MSRRGLGLAVLLLAGGSALLLGSGGRPWARVGVGQGAARWSVVEVTGDDLAPLVSAAGVVGLASVAALVATRGVLRRVCGAVVVLLGAAVLASTAAGAASAHVREVAAHEPEATSGSAVTGEVSRTAWMTLGFGGGAALAAGGAMAAVGGQRWPGLSGRHERPGTEAAAPDGTPEQVWDALDRGEDPTA